jgi:hypothetical protein
MTVTSRRTAALDGIKWLDPSGYHRWKDLGLRGLDTDGREDRSFRGRNEQRDAAFADALYGTGLRLTEAASLLLAELPADDPGRGYATCLLADWCAKGGYGHKYWMPRWALVKVLDYVEGARARAVRRAQREGRYDRLDRVRLVLDVERNHLRILEPDGRETRPAVNAVGPAARRRLFCHTCGGRTAARRRRPWWRRGRPSPGSCLGARTAPRSRSSRSPSSTAGSPASRS